MNGFRLAVAFLTRVPVGGPRPAEPDLARSVPWFPVVGVAIGLTTALVFAGLREALPALAAAAVALGFQLLVTGALHEDGLGDVADAFGLGRSRDEVVRILRDPRLGTFGVAAVSLSILVRVAALAALDAWEALAALPAAHALGRSAALALLAVGPPATDEGSGAAFGRDLSDRGAFLGCGAGLCLAAVAMGGWAFPAAAVCAAAAVVVGRAARRRIGGITGDVLGAVEQLGEMAVLLIAAAVATGSGSVPWWR